MLGYSWSRSASGLCNYGPISRRVLCTGSVDEEHQRTQWQEVLSVMLELVIRFRVSRVKHKREVELERLQRECHVVRHRPRILHAANKHDKDLHCGTEAINATCCRLGDALLCWHIQDRPTLPDTRIWPWPSHRQSPTSSWHAEACGRRIGTRSCPRSCESSCRYT